MGEIVEISTGTNQQANIFYKVTSGSFRFQVRGEGVAGISLVRRPCRTCKFWIAIEQGRIVVLNRDKKIYSVRTPPTRPTFQYAEFWLNWYDNVITIGRGDSDNPLFKYNRNTFALKYIAFASIHQHGGSLQWRFELPPLLENAAIREISSGALEWKSVNDKSLPGGAVIGGYEAGEMLYIIRAEHNGFLIPGKFVPSEEIAYVPWQMSLYRKRKFEILCGYDCVWVPCCDGEVPAGAVEGGYTANGNILYIGRAFKDEINLIPGPVYSRSKIFYMAIHDCYPNATNKYEILVRPGANMQCANPFLTSDLRLHDTARDYYDFEMSDDDIMFDGD